jgi:histidine triad (HIT) family protein
MDDCIFCKIINGELPSEAVYEDEFVYAFHDIHPQAPVHIWVIPKEHITSAADFNADNSYLAAKCFEAIAKIAKSEGLEDGYRVVTNIGADGGQIVFHVHFHLLGGAKFRGLVPDSWKAKLDDKSQ